MAEETKKVTEEVAETKEPKKTTRKKAVKKEEKVEETAPVTPEFLFRPAILKDFEILKHLIVTEETQLLRDKENALVFAVDKKANKTEIKNAVQAIFGAKVKAVNTINIRRKPKRVGRYSGFLPGYKKAIVRFDSSFDLGKIQEAVATEEMKATPEETK
ncbi:MAG TPA: 50S ribosomal protein L23 [Candidatus Enterosoma merdigallinarum]|nr:50S ribosomal protein L23 [Candidatus Enterosoma merdigallinarum]